ncbi:hypothetical protein QUB60_26750 [Microcoleus sp. A2-C5]
MRNYKKVLLPVDSFARRKKEEGRRKKEEGRREHLSYCRVRQV